MTRLEFFFDCSSPWTYLAFHRIEAVADEAGAELIWRPILVGGVFNAVNPSGSPLPGTCYQSSREVAISDSFSHRPFSR